MAPVPSYTGKPPAAGVANPPEVVAGKPPEAALLEDDEVLEEVLDVPLLAELLLFDEALLDETLLDVALLDDALLLDELPGELVLDALPADEGLLLALSVLALSPPPPPPPQAASARLSTSALRAI